MNINKIIILLGLIIFPIQAYSAEIPGDTEDTLTDRAIREYATRLPEAKYVVSLEADVPLLFKYKMTVFSASAVCIGDGTGFLTNAHCVDLWCDNAGGLKYPLYVKSNELRTKVIDVKIHPSYLQDKKNMTYDIAYLETSQKIEGLTGIEPTYIMPLSLIGRDVNIIGFGASGDFNGWLGRSDGAKRAVVSCADSLMASSPGSETNICLASSVLGYQYKHDLSDPTHPITALEKIPVKPYQAGFRTGMSGGGAFLDSQYVAIPARFSSILANNFWKRLKIKAADKLKYLSALGIPVPCMHNYLGDIEGQIVLGAHQEWIEKVRRAKKSIG